MKKKKIDYTVSTLVALAAASLAVESCIVPHLLSFKAACYCHFLCVMQLKTKVINYATPGVVKMLQIGALPDGRQLKTKRSSRLAGLQQIT